MGKMSVILILVSLITWVPQLLLFLFQLIERSLKHHSTFVDDSDMRNELVDFGQQMAGYNDRNSVVCVKATK